LEIKPAVQEDMVNGKNPIEAIKTLQARVEWGDKHNKCFQNEKELYEGAQDIL